MAANEDITNDVTLFLEDGLRFCREHCQCSNQDSLFRCTVKLCACLLVVNIVVGLCDDATLEPVWLGIFNVLSSLFILFEERLSSIQQRGTAIVYNGRGRPSIMIDIGQVENLVELGVPMHRIAEGMGISRVTLWRRLRESGYHMERFTAIDDATLDSAVSDITREFPNAGISMMLGFLRGRNIHVPRRRIRNSLVRVSPAGVLIRSLTTVARREYSVPSANSLWHIDGLHCFIRWRMVIHGGIDGFSRLIVYLHCSTNNRSSTVYSLFEEAIGRFGWPSRVRSDLGLENIQVAQAMIAFRGAGRCSHIGGASVHNQRIERLWRDTFTCACHLYYTIFYHLEDCGLLNSTDDRDLFAIHYVFLPRINRQLQQFTEAWNHHPMRTQHNQSPLCVWSEGIEEAVTNPSVSDHDLIVDGINTYGIDYAGPPLNPFDRGNIEVPDTVIDLPDNVINLLQTHVPLLHPSDCYGVDQYLFIRYIIHALVAQ